MAGDSDSRDKRQARVTLLAILVLLVLLLGAALLLLPQLAQIAETSLEPGLGLKNAAVISFFVTVALMVVFVHDRRLCVLFRRHLADAGVDLLT